MLRVAVAAPIEVFPASVELHLHGQIIEGSLVELQGAAGKAQRIKGKNADKAKSGAAEKPESRTSDKAISGDKGNAKDQDKGKDKPRRVPWKVRTGSLKDKGLRPLKRAPKKKDP